MTVPPIFEQANKLNAAGQYGDAIALYDQILTQNHANPGLLGTMATIYLRSGNTIGTAIALFHYAILCSDARREPVAPEIYSNLGLAYKYAGLMDRAAHYFEEALKVEKTAGVLCNYGSMFVEAGDAEKGISHLREAVKLDPTLELAKWNLSLIELATGKWEEGWENYEAGKAPGGLRPDRDFNVHPSVPLWDGKSAGRIAVSGEQGIGDEIMFASMLPDLLKTRGPEDVILECHPRLETLFQKSFPGVKTYPTRKEANIMWPHYERPDWRIAIGSLGKFYRRSLTDCPGTPYLKAEPSLPNSGKFRVGISWTGGRLSQRVAKRTVPLNWWKSILSVSGVEFVSLQYTDCEEEIASVEREGFTILQHPGAKATDYYEAAKLVASCDLVITVCTSVVHLAGALGVPAWVMVPKFPAWRYQNSGRNPFYRSVRHYRATEEGTEAYIPLVQTIGLHLDDLVSGRAQQQKVA